MCIRKCIFEVDRKTTTNNLSLNFQLCCSPQLFRMMNLHVIKLNRKAADITSGRLLILSADQSISNFTFHPCFWKGQPTYRVLQSGKSLDLSMARDFLSLGKRAWGPWRIFFKVAV